MMQEWVPTLSGDMTPADVRDTLNYVAGGASFEGWIAHVETYARKILADNGHDPERVGWTPTPLECGSTLDYAHEVLRWIRIARSAIKEQDAAYAAYAALRIARLVREHDLRIDWETPASLGQSFIEGRKAKRTDALGRLTNEALQELGGDASINAIFNYLRSQTTVVQEIDDEGTIYWKTRGREKKTGLKAFRNRLTSLRKRFNRLDEPK
jgi:hypothetical protein